MRRRSSGIGGGRRVWLLGVCLGGAAAFGADEGGGGADAPARAVFLISADELAKSLGGERFIIYDVRAEAAFAEGHVPGARRVDVGALSDAVKADETRESLEFWAKTWGELGLDAKARVVVYGDRLSDAARLWWILRYVGHPSVGLLDGGWKLWAEGEKPVTKKAKPFETTEFAPKLARELLALTDEVKTCAADAKSVVLDVRSLGEYADGRIPGAPRLEWTELVAEDGRFLPVAELKEIFAKAGLTPDKTIVPY